MISSEHGRHEPASERIQALLKSPLIIGASVSADWSTLSPGKRLALRYTSADQIRTQAQGGRMGRETLKLVQDGSYQGRTIVFGLDLFFWDSTSMDAEPTLSAFEKLLDDVRSRQLPLVLGDIPQLLPGRQPQRDALNRAIHRAASGPGCALMPFDGLHRQLMRDGYLVMRGQKLHLFEIVPDGLHLSAPAGEDLADRLRAVIEKSFL